MEQRIIHLGTFATPTEARKRYQDALAARQSGNWQEWYKNHLLPKWKLMDLPKGVTKRGKFFRARIKVNTKTVHLGYFPTPVAARERYQNALRAQRSGTWKKWAEGNLEARLKVFTEIVTSSEIVFK